MDRKKVLGDIRAEAARNRVSHEQLAEGLGMRPETFSRKLAGKVQQFTPLELRWLVEELHIEEERNEQ